MKKTIKIMIMTFLVIQVLDRLAAAAINRYAKNTNNKFKEINKRLWLERYKKTIPAWFDLTNR